MKYPFLAKEAKSGHHLSEKRGITPRRLGGKRNYVISDCEEEKKSF
jgi:hypothetical protein